MIKNSSYANNAGKYLFLELKESKCLMNNGMDDILKY